MKNASTYEETLGATKSITIKSAGFWNVFATVQFDLNTVKFLFQF